MFNIRVMRFVYIEIVSMSGLPTKSYTIFFRNSLIMLIGWQWLCRYWKKTNNQSNPFRSVKVTTCHTHQANDARLREIPHMVCSGWWFGTFSHILGIIIQTDFHIFRRGWSHQPFDLGAFTGPSSWHIWILRGWWYLGRWGYQFHLWTLELWPGNIINVYICLHHEKNSRRKPRLNG